MDSWRISALVLVVSAVLGASPLGVAKAQGVAGAPVGKASAAKPVAAPLLSKSSWADLPPAQQAALQPLAPSWGSISEGQKRKWIALAQNFQTLSTAERQTLHGRMTEWANLSPVQRSQARLNFAQTNKLSQDEKKAQWQAYQALSPEQKQRLAAGGQTLPGGAAPALKPVDPKKLATVPVTRKDPASAAAASRPLHGASAPQRPAKAASAPAQRP